MNGYLICVDLDGTLITDFDKYDKRSFDLLRKLSKTNYVVIATGRPLRSSIYYYNLLELNTPIINYNGTLIQNPKDPNFEKVNISVSKDDISKIFEDNSDIIDNIFCEVEDTIYLHKHDEDIKHYLHEEGSILHVGNFKDILPNNPNGAITFSKEKCEKRLTEYMEKHFKDKLLIRFWENPLFVIGEIYSPETSKGTGVELIKKYYNIPFEKTIAIGDGHNDIEMFQACKVRVCMENSNKDLLEYKTHITKSVTNNGVYHFLKDFFNIN